MKRYRPSKLLLSTCIAIALTTTASAQNKVDLHNLPNGVFKDHFDSLSEKSKTQALRWMNNIHAQEQDLPFMHFDKEGAVYFTDTFLPAATTATATTTSTTTTTANIIAPVDAFKLHSKPNASKVIYLDFNGHTVSGTAWSAIDLFAVPYDTDGDKTTFSDTERAYIADIWRRVSEDYAPFDIDVTTEEPASFGPQVGRVLITQDTDANGAPMPGQGAGGVAYVNVFGLSDYATAYSPAFVYYNNLGVTNTSSITEAASHEVGHNMGLSHDGTSTVSYYSGHGTGATSWGPIMGASYGRSVTQWSNGDYPDANQTEDDIAIIAAKLNTSADDHANTFAQASAIIIGADGSVLATTPISDPDNTAKDNKGIIESRSDIDMFSFTTTGGDIALTVSPARDASNTSGGNLDISLSLYNEAGTLVTSNDPATETNASINTTVAAGVYYLSVEGVGSANYSDYGSQGQYFITGTIPVLNDTTAPNPDPMSWASAPTAIDRFSLSMTAVTATDDNSAVEYNFICNSGNCADSGWQTSSTYIASNLAIATNYSFQVVARDAAGNETAPSEIMSAQTLDNIAPIAQADSANVNNNASVSINVLDNDSDSEGDTLSVNAVTQASNGNVTYTATNVSYTPSANFVGEDSFTYSIDDGYGGTATATVTVTVNSIATNNSPVANNDSATVNNTSSVTIDVLANDNDADNDSLTISNVTQATNGSVSIVNNRIEYTPNANFVGSDNFDYSIEDGNGGTATATVIVTVTEVATDNNAPIAKRDRSRVAAGQSIVIDVLKNDTDQDADPLSIVSVTQGNKGTVTIENNQLVYIATGQHGSDNFNYTISDGKGGTDTARVTVFITKAANTSSNRKPVAKRDSLRISKGETVTIDVLANDSDRDNDPLTITSVTDAHKGTVSIENNQLLYTAGNRRGRDSLTYTVSDGKGGVANAKVIVFIR